LLKIAAPSDLVLDVQMYLLTYLLAAGLIISVFTKLYHAHIMLKATYGKKIV